MAQSCVTFPISTQIFEVETRSSTTQIQSTDCIQVVAGQTTCVETIVIVIEKPIIYESQNILYQTSCSKSPQGYPVTTTPILPTITSFTPISPSQTASKSETSGTTAGANVGPIEPTITTITFITAPTGQNTTSNPRAMIIEAVVSVSLGLIMLALLVYFLLRRRARRNGTRPTPYTHDSIQPAQRAKPPLLSGTTSLSATSANFERDARATNKEQISSSVPLSTSRDPEPSAPPPYSA